MTVLGREFYVRPANVVAPDLLNKVLVRQVHGTRMSGRIVEVEAYMGRDDPASHAYRRPTPRNEVMFGAPGYAYVYVSYGMHHCLNLVTDPEGAAGAVLIRALEPLEGIDEMFRRRGTTVATQLCSGPGKLCQALGIDRDDNGSDLNGPGIAVEDRGDELPAVAVSNRVGVTRGCDLPWRFFISGNSFVSRGKPA